MKAVYHRGLNCHLASVVTAAAALGIEHERAYAALWSESVFGHDAAHRVRTSRRVYERLHTLGLRMEGIGAGCASADGGACAGCASTDGGVTADVLRPSSNGGAAMDAVYAAAANGDILLVGMDSARAPWSPVYGGMGDIHYCAAQGNGAGVFACCDPVFGAEDVMLGADYLLVHAFELRRVYRAEAEPLRDSVVSEAHAVMRGHPPLLKRLTEEITACAGEGRGLIAPLCEFISAMIDNRCLFGRFLLSFPRETDALSPLFGKDFLARWEAVKHGLLKASVLKKNEAVLSEVNCMLDAIMREEMDMAGAVVCQSAGEHII